LRSLETIVVISLVLLVPNNIGYAAGYASSVKASQENALDSIRIAETNGVDVSDLVVWFNQAVEFERQAETSDFSSCVSLDDCNEKADRLFNSIEQVSIAMTDQSKTSSTHNMVTIFGLFAVGAFAASLVVAYVYLNWRTFKVQRFLEMEIKKGEN